MILYGKTSSHAIAVMSYLAANPDRLAGSAEIAESREISKPLTAKLLTRLATAGWITGQPGPGGGYRLARPAGEIRLIDIASLFERMDSPVPCPFGLDWCGNNDPCPLHDQILALQEAGRQFLEQTRLSAFSKETADCKAMATGI